MTDFVQYEQDAGVATLTLNDPERRNALSNQAQWDAVVAACERVQRDPSVRCVILTGSGSAFCAGGNVKDMKQRSASPPAAPTRSARATAPASSGSRWRCTTWTCRPSPPSTARRSAPAATSTCMCDIRIAVGSREIRRELRQAGHHPRRRRRVAAAAGRRHVQGGRTDLHRRHDRCRRGAGLRPGVEGGRARAADGRGPGAGRADRANPGPALRMAKRLLREGQHMRIESLLEMSAALQALAHHTPEHGQALDAFLASMKR